MTDRMFSYDGPVARFIIRFAQLFWLNILTIICMLPVITFGPSMKALSYTALKIERDEEDYVTKTFLRSFKENFWQTVLLGIIAALLLFIMGGSIYALIMLSDMFPVIYKAAFILVLLIVVFVLVWVFPLQARFVNTIGNTIKNAFWLSISKIGKTLIMSVMWLFIPACVIFVSGNFMPLVFFFGFSFPSYINAKLYSSYFRSVEDKIKGKTNAEDGDFSDNLPE